MTQVVAACHQSSMRVSQFSGENQKGDVDYEIWKAEVKSLRDANNPLTSILYAIRKSVRGRAAMVLLRLGGDVTLEQVLHRFDVVFGNVLPSRTLLEQYYTARQGTSESIAAWACRLEDLLGQARQTTTGITYSESQEMLTSKFWGGLIEPEVKSALRHKLDTASFEDLLVSARMAEQEMNLTRQQSAAAGKAANVNQMNTQTSSLDRILEELQKLNKRVVHLEEDKGGRNRNPRKQGCWKCGQENHLKKDCPN